MTRTLRILMVVGVLTIALGAQATITGITSPFSGDNVDWCQLGCPNVAQAPSANPQAWVSTGGSNTGWVGINNSGGFNQMYVLQQDQSWFGTFTSGMGVVYSGAAFGNNPPEAIDVTFDQGQGIVGAYIEANYYFLPYTATIELFDSSFNSLGVFSENAAGGPPIFIGASSDTPIFAVEFDIQQAGHDHDFGLGELTVATPEPSSFILMGSALAGLAGVIRRKAQKR